MELMKDVKYIGVNDYEIDLFEGQYPVPKGMAYNSYVIIDEKIAVMDTVEARFTAQWLDNLKGELNGRTPDYLIVQHMEPDHSANIANFVSAYPDVKIVASARAFVMMKKFFGDDFKEKQIVAEEGTQLDLGLHKLTFVTAPMVHWPEVIMTWDSTAKILFSADAFGKFGAMDAVEPWEDEARRYYIGIVGKYGAQVQAVLKKAAALDIETICPLHGPVLKENLGHYVNLYDTWSSYKPEEEGIVLAYTSVYGNTEKAVLQLADLLKEGGAPAVKVYDLARCDMFEAVADAFRYDKLVLATTTYNGDIFPFMRHFIGHLTERNFQKRTVALLENGSWAPQAARIMKSLLEKSRDLTFADTTVTIHSALSEESGMQLAALAEELLRAPSESEEEKPAPEAAVPKKKFVCKICGYVHEADSLPEDFICPLCRRPASDFEEM